MEIIDDLLGSTNEKKEKIAKDWLNDNGFVGLYQLLAQEELLRFHLEDVVSQACAVETDNEDSVIYDSMAISAYANAILMLESVGHVVVEEQHGRRVTARAIKDVEPQFDTCDAEKQFTSSIQRRLLQLETRIHGHNALLKQLIKLVPEIKQAIEGNNKEALDEKLRALKAVNIDPDER